MRACSLLLLTVFILWLGGCAKPPHQIVLENRTETLMTVSVEALGERTLGIIHDEVPDAAKLGQERFASRPAGRLRGLSADRRSFGPMRINPSESVRFSVLEPPLEAGEPPRQPGEGAGEPALRVRATPILSRRELLLIELLPAPLPALVTVTNSPEGYRIEVPAGYAPAFEIRPVPDRRAPAHESRVR